MYKKTIKFFSLLVMALSIIMTNTLLGQSKSKEFMDLLATAPTVEFMVKFNQEANRRTLYNDKYRAIWNGYVKDAFFGSRFDSSFFTSFTSRFD